MKKVFRTIALTLILTLAFPILAFGATEPAKTNIAGTMIMPSLDGLDGFIKFGASSEEKISGDYVGLFVNGSIIENAEVIVEDGRSLVPVRVIAEGLGAEVDWAAENGRIIITTEDRGVVMYIGRNAALINGGEYFLDTPPQIIDGRTYVPLRFVSEALYANVEYSDGADLTKPYIIPRVRHIMISAYPSEWKPLTTSEAIKKVQDQLITAYEKKYGEYVPVEPGYAYKGTDVKEMLRGKISNLEISSENDRYYILPLTSYDLWVDKYTGDTYLFHNGQTMSITEFDPDNKDALAFVG